jgi:hypothetical protein
MKYLKLFENFNKSEIDEICNEYDIKNYIINPDGSIDVEGSVDLSYKRISELPLKFNMVSEYFNCSNNQLTTLEGAPNYVGKDLFCQNNKLTSLDGFPNVVGGESWIQYNPIHEITRLFGYTKIYLEYQETYNFVRKDSKVVKYLFEEALNDYNEYYNKEVKLPEEIYRYTYI